MVRTRVGYTGGTLKDPTYHHLGDHTESVQMDFDPSVVPYERLLEIFWLSHHPSHRAWSRQYRSAVFYHSREQLEQARVVKKRAEARVGHKLFTDIVPAGIFYLAEDYHQKYLLRRNPSLMNEFSRIYPKAKDLIHSTTATRVNGYLGGHGSVEQLKREIDRLGLTVHGQKVLLSMMKK